MTAVEYAGGAAPRAAVRARALLRRVELDSVWLQLLTVYLLLLLLRLPALVAPDSWLAFVAGRQIGQHGLPRADALTDWTLGRHWIDQQWLGQLALYGTVRLGGLRLALALDLALLVTALGVVLAAARRGGASSAGTALAGALVLFAAAPSTALRTETLAYVLFAALVWLLLADVRRPSTGVLWVVPLLVLWANVHGSVVLGAALAALRALDRLAPARLRTSALLLAGSCAAVFASPYAASLPAYYSSTIGNRPFRRLLSEWAPSTPSAQWRFLLLALIALAAGALAARARRSPGRFELGVSLLLFVAAVDASRNIVWFALFLAAVLPTWLDRARRVARVVPPPRRLARAVWAVLGTVTCVAAVAAFGRPAGWYAQRYPEGATPALRAVVSARPSARILATDRLADWILWTLPTTRGRLAYDTRFELLPASRLRELERLVDARPGWQQSFRGYDVAVLERGKYSRIRSGLLELGARPLYEDADVSVLRLAVR